MQQNIIGLFGTNPAMAAVNLQGERYEIDFDDGSDSVLPGLAAIRAMTVGAAPNAFPTGFF